MNSTDRSAAGSGLFIGAGIVAAAFILSGTWREHQRSQQTLDVSGSAEKAIVSDLGIFRCSLTGEGPTAQSAHSVIEEQRPTLLSYFAGKGFDAKEVKSYPMSTWTMAEMTPQGHDTGRILKVVYTQRYEVTSTDVALIDEISTDISNLVEQGVYVQPEFPEYHFTKLADVKAEVQELAAHDASERARRIAEATGKSLGPIRRARMGVIQITPRNSTMISDYGMNDVSAIEKEVTAVAHASFSLE